MNKESRYLRTCQFETSKGESGIWLMPEGPFWFVPSPLGDKVLQECDGLVQKEPIAASFKRLTGCVNAVSEIEAELFSRRLSFKAIEEYAGRANRPLSNLSEIWIHLTDKCNLKCSHCLFYGNQDRKRSIQADLLERTVDEAYVLGARLICLTGGEPFSYPGLPQLIARMLERTELTVAVLTNALLAQSLLKDKDKIDRSRLHIQVSIDGTEEFHDAQRGKGTFLRTCQVVRKLLDAGFSISVAMAVNKGNLEAVRYMPEVASALGVSTLHYQYHINRGAGKNTEAVPAILLGEYLMDAYRKAKELNIAIDNIESIRSQVFTAPGTRFDLGNGAWESLAVGPDGNIYPTPAMVDQERFCAGNVAHGLEKAWRKSRILIGIRALSLLDSDEMARDPYRFMTGGGDIDHALRMKEDALFLDNDPYSDLYRKLVEELIKEKCTELPVVDGLGLILRMGEVVSECTTSPDVNFMHCNCLLSLGSPSSSNKLVREFYGSRAQEIDPLILNPSKFHDIDLAHVPDKAKSRMYGCGSPVTDAGLKPGQYVVDLGCGAGAECIIASKKVGPKGKVIGIDMTSRMIDVATSSYQKAKKSMDYDNVLFLKAYLEEPPLATASVDVVISNCVLNLCTDKRRVFAEIFRILKPGGKLVVADVVCEAEPSLEIRTDRMLKGQCIGGAMLQDQLFGLLKDMGFVRATALKRFPYKNVKGHQFHSLTFQAEKPGHSAHETKEKVDAFYAGPFKAVVTDDNEILLRGVKTKINKDKEADPSTLSDSGLYLLDAKTSKVTNLKGESSCSCHLHPNVEDLPTMKKRHYSGCFICGADLVYLKRHQGLVCEVCGRQSVANAMCKNGHFVCDLCHEAEPIQFIKNACLKTKETDMIRLLYSLRSSAFVAMHGPEHHAMVPGIILSTYRNLGGEISDKVISDAIERGGSVAGGSCAFMGFCGAAAGAGIALSAIVGATPILAEKRQLVQAAVARILGVISKFKAGRCCQRESFVTLKEVAKISKELLPLRLKADFVLRCAQFKKNRECIKGLCPLFPCKKEADAPLHDFLNTSPYEHRSTYNATTGIMTGGKDD